MCRSKLSKRAAARLGGAGPRRVALACSSSRAPRRLSELTVGQAAGVTELSTASWHEPFEAMTIDCPEEFVGAITQLMAARKGRMEEMTNPRAGWVRMDSSCPAAG